MAVKMYSTETHCVHEQGTLLRSLCFDHLLNHTVIHILTQLHKLVPLMEDMLALACEAQEMTG